MSGTHASTAANQRTLLLFGGLVLLVTLIAWPSLAGRLQYAKVRAELRAIRDAAVTGVRWPTGWAWGA